MKEEGEEIGRQLTEHEDLLNYVCTLLAHDKTCLTACQFLEDLLQARRQVLCLSTIRKFLPQIENILSLSPNCHLSVQVLYCCFILCLANLKNLITCLDDQKLANFCRVLAVTISDLDIYENKSSCKHELSIIYNFC